MAPRLQRRSEWRPPSEAPYEALEVASATRVAYVLPSEGPWPSPRRLKVHVWALRQLSTRVLSSIMLMLPGCHKMSWRCRGLDSEEDAAYMKTTEDYSAEDSEYAEAFSMPCRDRAAACPQRT